jgi:putative hemolysin
LADTRPANRHQTIYTLSPHALAPAASYKNSGKRRMPLVDVGIILLLILFNGLLSMSEMAVVSSRRVRLQQMAESGSAGAGVALELVAHPNRFLSTVQVGITAVGILAGTFGGAALSGPVSDLLSDVPALDRYSEPLGVALVVIAITYLSLIIGELAPKRLALQNPERVASIVARPMQMLSRGTGPIVWFLSVSTEFVMRLLRVKKSNQPEITEDEIRLLLAQGADTGVIEEAEEELVDSIFRLGDRNVGSLMTPRHQIVYLDLNDTAEENRQNIESSGYDSYPVCRDGLDRVVGFIQVRDLWTSGLAPTAEALSELITDPQFVPEQAPALDALEQMRTAHSQKVMVVDEYGGIQGMLALDDILDAIVGDQDEHSQYGDADVIRRDEQSWLINGMTSLEELEEALEIDGLLAQRRSEYNTVGGLVMDRLGRIPHPSDTFECLGYMFEVVDMDGNRVDKVIVSKSNGRSD